jgi:hypothetical protein
VHRSPGKSAPWWLIGLVTIAAATLAGALAGGALGAAGSTMPLDVRVSVGLLGALVLVPASVVRRIPLPQLTRETEQALLHRGPLQWAIFNGGLLGLGFTSRIGFWTWYFIPLACLTSGSSWVGALVWGSYGLLRMTVTVGAAVRMRHVPAMVVVADALLGGREAARRTTNLLALVLAAILALRLGL